MNSKVIAAGVVVALCAVALIGVGYAYTATVTTADNEFGADYITIRSGSATEAVWNQTRGSSFSYDTVTQLAGTEFISKNTATSGTVTIAKTSGVSSDTVTLSMIIDLDDVIGDKCKKLFKNEGDYATVTFSGISGNVSTSFNSDTNEVTWSGTVSISGSSTDVTVSIAPVAGINMGTLASAPLIDNLPIKFVASDE